MRAIVADDLWLRRDSDGVWHIERPWAARRGAGPPIDPSLLTGDYVIVLTAGTAVEIEP